MTDDEQLINNMASNLEKVLNASLEGNGLHTVQNQSIKDKFYRLIELSRIGAAVQQKIEDSVIYATSLMAAATHDWECAGYDEVGLHGAPIKTWREAYRSGCNDMSSGIIQRLGTHDPEQVKALYTKELESLKVKP